MSESPPGRVRPGVRAVVFDAVGTLLRPEPAAAAVYADFGRRFGSRLAADEIRRRFAAAFASQESLDAAQGHRTDEAREAARWRAIVAAVVDDVDGEGCFLALYDHFAAPSSWRCDPEAAGVIAGLRRRGLVVGMASNFDGRLRPVVAGLPELAELDRLWISSEVGWKKPAGPFFAAVCRTLALPPAAVLFVGDDAGNDHAGAKAAGLRSLLLDPAARSGLPRDERIDRLGDLLDPGRN